MRDVEQQAYLLHSRPFKDNQVIAEFLTKDLGKVAAVTYVSSSSKHSKKAILQPFIPLVITLKGKGNLKSASAIEATGKSFVLAGTHLFSALYVNELQCKLLTESVPSPLLFDFYQETISRLAQQQEVEPILRAFEWQLLQELGYALDFSSLEHLKCQYCQFLPDVGFIAFEQSNQGSALERSHLLAIANEQALDKAAMQTFKLLMRQVIHYLLDGRPLNSRKLFTR
ncbi:DNA repair protein RecO [Thalassotalea marina]|uniref:DNA repair protein RecO n=1 Tax=Thalassotalea marina TaxID=1673741 RepID=A0A919BF49_9GAMM|nr:DNA repair protein RecO [Thalassotalea marina]GHF84544.1 DNA repair protein RecO [Thalassotalea marina]